MAGEDRLRSAEDQRTAVERRVERSFEDPTIVGQRLSRRTRQTKRTVEAYLKAGVIPRYMQRAREIEQAKGREQRQLERAYRLLREECGADAELFASRWLERARSWNFERVNELIREHNEWYPIESQLPMDPRTRDYVLIRGRSYRREELGAAWVLERFPPRPAAA